MFKSRSRLQFMGAPLGMVVVTLIAVAALMLLHEIADADDPPPPVPALVDAGPGLDAGPYRTPAVVAAPPPATLAQDLLGGMLSGRYLVAVASALLLLVAGLRAGLARFVHPWFGTRVGGYVVNLATSVGGYLGIAWRAGAPVSIGIVLAALGTALAAAGGWEAARDAVFGKGNGASSSSSGAR